MSAETGTVLALDATGEACSVAVLMAHGASTRRIEPMLRGHAERLFPLIEESLAEAGASPGQVDVFAAARGPGSFTGVRIGVAAIRGLALATGAKAVGVDSFFAVAAAAAEAGLQAKDVLVLFGKPPRLVGRRFAIGPAGATALDEMAALRAEFSQKPELVIGPAWAAGVEAFEAAGAPCAADDRFARIDPLSIACLAAGGGPSVGAPSPIYLRPPDAEPSQELRPARLGPRREGLADR